MMTRQREPQLGREIRRLRLQSGTTLRGLAARLGVSAPHLSDIEHDRRRPSETLLRKIAYHLRATGTSYESLRELITGIDPETRDWVAATPGVRAMLLLVRKSKRPPRQIIEILEKNIGRDGKPVSAPTRKVAGSPKKRIRR